MSALGFPVWRVLPIILKLGPRKLPRGNTIYMNCYRVNFNHPIHKLSNLRVSGSTLLASYQLVGEGKGMVAY